MNRLAYMNECWFLERNAILFTYRLNSQLTAPADDVLWSIVMERWTCNNLACCCCNSLLYEADKLCCRDRPLANHTCQYGSADGIGLGSPASIRRSALVSEAHMSRGDILDVENGGWDDRNEIGYSDELCELMKRSSWIEEGGGGRGAGKNQV